RANAAFVVLVRNSELWDMLKSMRQVEDRFNKKFNYPWVFLNDEPFTDEFKRKTTHMTSGKTEYGLIPKEHWDYPEFIDQAKAAERLKQMDKDGVMYGGMLSYHKMCRFNSGFFYRQELVKKYDYYWRVEPGITYHCDINYDPFLLMMDNGYKYSYTIGLHEYGNTVPTLFDTTKDFMKKNPHLIPKHNGQTWLYDDPRKSLEEASYNMCHFWSNFEIGDVRFFNSERYTKFFDHLDRTGGFFYERWGDAPVHSIAAAILLAKEEVHWFNDFGYYHNPWHMCPQDEQRLTQCSCNPKDSLHLSDWGSCAR
ncbi:glycosyl transferase, partial [Ramicandelaber brevisporus]